MVDPAQEAPPSPRAGSATESISCGLDRLLLDADVGEGQANANGSLAAVVGTGPGPQAQSLSTVSFPDQTGPVPTKIRSAPTSGSGNPPRSFEEAAAAALQPSEEATAVAAAKVAAAAIAMPKEVQARGSLVVSPPPAPLDAEAAPVSVIPAVTLSSKSPPKATIGRKTGPKKMGARKLGAMKLGSGAGAVKLSGFQDPQATPTPGGRVAGAAPAAGGVDADLKLARKLQEEEDARASGSSLLAAATAEAFAMPPAPSSKEGGLGATAGGGSVYRSLNDSASKGSSYGYGNGEGSRSVGASSGFSSISSYGGGGSSSSASFDKEKYKNVKGIGSDMLFGAQDDDPAEQHRRAMKTQEYSSSAAISSDMYFDRNADEGMGNASGGDGLGEMAEQIRLSAAVEFEGAAQAAAKLKVCILRRCFSHRAMCSL